MKVLVEGEEMAKSVKCLLHKQADLRLTAQNSHKMRSWVWQHIPVIAALEKPTQEDSWDVVMS